MKKHFILLIFCCLHFSFLQAQDNKEEMKTLLRKTKIFLGNYRTALNRLSSPKTDVDVLVSLTDSIEGSFFASPATKVFNDLEPNGADLLPIYATDYLGNMANSVEKGGIVTSLDICNAEISPQIKTTQDGKFSYFEIIVLKKTVGFNQDGKEIKQEKRMSFLISFESKVEDKEGIAKKIYGRFLIRKIEPSLHDANDYIREPSDLLLNYAPTKVHLNSRPSITWQSVRKEGEVNVELWEVGKSKPITLVSNLPITAKKYKWQVGNSLEVGKSYLLRVKNLSDPLCMSAETSPFTAKPKIKKGRWIAIGSAVLVGTLTLLFKNKLFPPQEPLLPEVPRNNPK